jgi:large subunit ribosomal protein L5
VLENAVDDMAKIAGQKPVVTKARVSVASFKIRDGWPIGCQGHLRRAKHVRVPGSPGQHLAAARARLPRVSGRAFDGRGNYNMGVKEQIIFPEIDFDQVDALRGMDIASPRPRRPMKKPRRCSKPSASRSATNQRRGRQKWPRLQW